jgi:hypothetical protein
MRRSRLLVLGLIVAVLALTPSLASAQSSAARPAAIVQTHPSLLALPKFVFHAGLAFGAFHHFIYLPFKAGKFTKGSFLSKLKNYTEAGLAGLFVYHETKLALADAQKNKALKVLVSPLTALVGAFNAIVSKIKSHNLDSSTMSSAQSAVTSVESQAKGSGSSISEAVPSSKQLLTGSA